MLDTWCPLVPRAFSPDDGHVTSRKCQNALLMMSVGEGVQEAGEGR